jgi:polyisoprenyl-phosphate glycosyltransferase
VKEMELSVVVPAYNEEEVLVSCHERLTKVLAATGLRYEIIYVDDGSRDRTPDIIRGVAASDKHVQFLGFSRNFGHQPAISAGFEAARGKAIIAIDADLQDPPEVIPDMIAKWREGFDVVYGRRASREGETLFKKATSKAYYRTLSRLTDVSIPVDVGDFRLIDRKVCDALNGLKEKHRYVRGLIAWLGFKQAEVSFARAPRAGGVTKYPLKRMISFAVDGIVSFSSKPLRLAAIPGLVMAVAGFCYFVYVLVQKFSASGTETGWASLMSVILSLNGYTLVILGIMGEYLGRLFDEAKGRPLYVVRERIEQDPR